ncbi:MAG: GNAT family N-acetyltransferase [Alphaproteobacteria bacterium]|nr:GNAT family N-acetyltransferase [Alphaproteobacteria bacterium]MCK5658369.1 GNAT family N-acetyltransferase [Alphaproteobacteria bacterium]
MEKFFIREATVADADAIARVHVDSWRESYAGIFPDDILRNLSWEERAGYWKKELLEEKSQGKIFVAEEGGIVKGFVSAGKSRKPEFPFDGEIYSLYLLKEAQGRGIGRKLFEIAQNSLKLGGMNSMFLLVLKDNSPTIEFYRYMGGKEFSRIKVNILEEIAMGWEKNWRI